MDQMESSTNSSLSTSPGSACPNTDAHRTACKSFSAWPEIMGIEDIMGCLGLSQRHATGILKDKRLARPFPSDRRNMVVGKFALRDYLNGRTVQEGDT